MPTPISIRFIEEEDLRHLAEAERLANSRPFDDPDFGPVTFCNPWAMSEADIVRLIEQRNSSRDGTHETKTYVTEVMREEPGDSGQAVERPWVCGGFSFETHAERYELLYLVASPAGPTKEVLRAVLVHMKALAERSTTRRQVVAYIRDRDEAGLRVLAPLFMKEGFKLKLVRDHFGEHDGWRCTWEAGEDKRPPSRRESMCV